MNKKDETQAGSELSDMLGGALEESLVDTLVTKCEALIKQNDRYRDALREAVNALGECGCIDRNPRLCAYCKGIKALDA